MISLVRSPVLLLAVVSTIAQLACKSDSSTITSSPPAIPDLSTLKVSAVTPTLVEGVVGAVAAFSPTVKVISTETELPVANIEVHFSGSAVNFAVALTDKDGLASAGSWRFATKAGLESLSVSLGKQVRLRFFARLTHDVPADIHVSNDGELVGLAGREVAGFGMQVVDQFGNGVSGVPLSFSVSAGALDSSRVISDRGGGAYTGRWLLDETPATSQLTISADGLKPKVVFGVGIDPSTVQWYKLKEYRTGAIVIPAPEPGITQARFGVTGMEKCPCIAGFFIDEMTYASTPPSVSQYGGRFSLVGSSLKLPVSNPISEGAYAGAQARGDELLIDRVHFIYIGDYPIPVDVVVVTWVYTRIAN